MWFHFASEQCSCGIIRSKHDGSYLVETHFPLPAAYYPVYHHLTSVADPASTKIRRFFELILLETADSAEKKAPADTRDEGLAGAVKSFIRSRNGVNCSLDELEHAFGYSRSHLSHVFRRCAGMSIGECIDLVRIDCMREQRAHGMKQKEIAAELGFASASAFWLWRERLRRKGVQI